LGYNFNQATLVGRLTKDPELKEFSDNASKTTFSLAVNRSYKKENGETEADFIPVCLWGKLAEVSFQLLRKGTPVLVWGKIQVRNYEKDKERRWMTEVVAENFQILEKVSSDPTKEKKM
jgi:single-strand DNA-binding protein